MKICFPWNKNKNQPPEDIREILNVKVDTTDCAFCLNEIEIASNITLTCCKHAYHTECWTAYVYFASKKRNLSELRCPICRDTTPRRLIDRIIESKNR